MQIAALDREQVEVLICGEADEWQTREYVRDAIALGKNKGLILLGHECNEEPGMAYLVEWLCPKLPGIPITHVPAGDPIEFV